VIAAARTGLEIIKVKRRANSLFFIYK